MDAHERSVSRTKQILARQLPAGRFEHPWELELGLWLEVDWSDTAIQDFERLFQASLDRTSYLDGYGPWGRSIPWDEENYGIGNTHAFLRLLELGGGVIQGFEKLVGWLQSLEAPDGSVAAQAEFARILRARSRERAAQRDRDARAGWDRALGPGVRRDAPWPNSELEDAFHWLGAMEVVQKAARAPQRVAAWIGARQRADGAFRAPLTVDAVGEPYGSSLEDTAFAARALARLRMAPPDAERCVAWLLDPGACGPAFRSLHGWRLRLEALDALDAIDRAPPWIDEWLRGLEFSTDPGAERVGFDAWMAIRAVRLRAHLSL